MSHRAARIMTLLMATASACLAATGADAQSTGRYLTWANRPANTTPADVVADQTRVRNAIIPRRVAPSQGYTRPTMQAPASTIAVSRGLTPASAWLGPRIAPAFAPGSPDPISYATTELAAAPAPTYSAPPPVERTTTARAPVERVAVDPMAPRRDAPVFNLPRAQPPVPEQAPQPVADGADPMAPRRDARIFQMQQAQTQGQERAALPAEAQASSTQAAPSAQSSVQSGQSGARYYSVHRDAGHRPDPTVLPEPVYFDSVTLDLAEPPADEPQTRDAQGRSRVVPNQDPSLP